MGSVTTKMTQSDGLCDN